MINSIPVILVVGTLLGFLAGLGIGGGSLLVLWLTFAGGMDPLTIRGINLLFFIPSAIIATCFRWKQNQIPWKKIIPAMVSGCIAALLFSWLGNGFDMELLKRLFGGLLIITGLRELFYRPRKLR